MIPAAFTDWRNRHVAAEPGPPPKNYLPSPIPLTNRVDGNSVDWVGPSEDGGCYLSCGKAGKRSWSYPPGVNATRWRAEEGRHYWYRLPHLSNYPLPGRVARINDDERIHKWENKVVTRTRRRWMDCAVFCSRLELTPYQQLRVHYLYEASRSHKRTPNGELCIFILAVLVCREDGRQFTRHPSSKSEDPLFDKVATEEGFKPKHIRRWIKKLPLQEWAAELLGNEPPRNGPWPAGRMVW